MDEKMSTRAILVNFHLYTPFGKIFYEPLLDYFLTSMKRFEDEYDMLYLLDSNWEIDPKKIKGMKAKIVRTDPNMRYYDCFKKVLPQVEEDLVLFLDDDMIIYKERMVKSVFDLVDPEAKGTSMVVGQYDVASITDTIGTMEVSLRTGNKLCPYFFATRKDLLMKYLDVDWSGDNMPYTETFGLLTEAMLKDGCKVFELEDDKEEMKKDLGYFHIRAGSTPAYLLATKHYGDIETYWAYLKNQPREELERHCKWYKYLGGDPSEILEDLEKGRV